MASTDAVSAATEEAACGLPGRSGVGVCGAQGLARGRHGRLRGRQAAGAGATRHRRARRRPELGVAMDAATRVLERRDENLVLTPASSLFRYSGGMGLFSRSVSQTMEATHQRWPSLRS